MTSFKILEPNELSDHSAIQIKMHARTTNTEQIHDTTELHWRVKWNSVKVNEFVECIDSKDNALILLANSVNSDDDVNTILKSFTALMHECTYTLSKNNNKRYPKTNKSKRPKQKWFNAECFNARKIFQHTRNVFLRDKNNTDKRRDYLTARTQYNKTKRRNKYL